MGGVVVVLLAKFGDLGAEGAVMQSELLGKKRPLAFFASASQECLQNMVFEISIVDILKKITFK